MRATVAARMARASDQAAPLRPRRWSPVQSTPTRRRVLDPVQDSRRGGPAPQDQATSRSKKPTVSKRANFNKAVVLTRYRCAAPSSTPSRYEDAQMTDDKKRHDMSPTIEILSSRYGELHTHFRGKPPVFFSRDQL